MFRFPKLTVVGLIAAVGGTNTRKIPDQPKKGQLLGPLCLGHGSPCFIIFRRSGVGHPYDAIEEFGFGGTLLMARRLNGRISMNCCHFRYGVSIAEVLLIRGR